MSEEKTNWYRTGAVAKQLGTSPRQVRELARAGLIESQLRNGFRYIPGREVERLKNEGLPPMPADLEPNDTNDADQQADGSPRPGRNRLTQDLYAEPSRQLARSKEKVIRLEHTVQAKQHTQEIRQIDNAARAEKAHQQEAQKIKAWRDPYIRCAVERVPAEVCADLCARINDLLDTVPPFSDVTAKVAELIEIALRPIKKREAEARALEAQRKKISEIVRALRLPYGAAFGELEEARELAHGALANLPAGCSDRQLRTTAESAIQTVVDRIGQRKKAQEARRADQEQRRADEECRRRQSFLETCHKTRIAETVSLLGLALPGATDQELADARQRVRIALERLEPSCTHAEFSAVQKKVMAPFGAAIHQRQENQHRKETEERAEWVTGIARTREAQRRAESLLLHVETRLQQLEGDGIVTFDGDWDRRNLRDKVIQKIRPLVVEKIAANLNLRDYEIKQFIRDLVDQHHVEFCE